MPNPINEFLAAISQPAGTKKPDLYPAMLDVALKQPDQMGTLLRTVMRQIPRAGTFFQDAISYLPIEDFPALATEAVGLLNTGKRTYAVESFIEHCSLQAPQALHPHLDILLHLKPNHYCAWPWRESGKTHLESLRTWAESPENDWQVALDAMFETRDPEVLSAALKLRPRKQFMPGALRLAKGVTPATQEAVAELAVFSGNAHESRDLVPTRVAAGRNA